MWGSEARKDRKLCVPRTMPSENSGFCNICSSRTAGGAIDELVCSSVIISIKMSSWCSANSGLHFIMVIQGRSSLQIGYQCFTMHFGHRGLAFSPLCLKEMLIQVFLLLIQHYIKQGLRLTILTSKSFGGGWHLLLSME